MNTTSTNDLPRDRAANRQGVAPPKSVEPPHPDDLGDAVPLVALTVLDAALARRLDWRISGDCKVRLRGLMDPVVVQVDGKDAVRLERAERGKGDLDCGLRLYEAVVAQTGVDPSPTSLEDWVAEGTSSMRAILSQPIESPLAQRAGAVAVVLRTAESVGRCFGMSPERISEITGVPFVPGRSLFPPLRMAMRLHEDKFAREAEAKAEQEAAAVVARELARPRTITEGPRDKPGRLVVAEVKTIDLLKYTPPILRQDPRALATMPGTRLFAASAQTQFFAWEGLLEIPIPACFADNGQMRVLDSSELIPAGAATGSIRQLDLQTLEFFKDLQAQAGIPLDFTRALHDDYFRDGVAPEAEAIADDAVASGADGWRLQLAVERVVAYWRVDPAPATELFVQARRRRLDAEVRPRRPGASPRDIEAELAPFRAQVERLTCDAADHHRSYVGAVVEPTVTTKNKKGS